MDATSEFMGTAESPPHVKWARALAYVGIAAYFGLIVLPEWFPALGQSGLRFPYVASIPCSLVALLGIGAWGGGAYLHAKGNGRTPKPRNLFFVRFAVFGILCLPAAMILLALIRGGFPGGSRALLFDAAVWQRSDPSVVFSSGVMPRQQMLADLVENVLPGKTRAEIQALIGPGLDPSGFGSTSDPCDLVYETGAEPGFIAIDSECLLIWLDEADRFERFEIYND